MEQQIGSGPEDFSLDNDQLYVDDTPVESGEAVYVDPATTHKLYLPHNVLNADPRSLGDPIGVWRTCMTVYNVTDTKAVGSSTSQADGGAGGGNPSVAVGKISKAITFKVKLWANQNDGAVPPSSAYWS
jgi:hypothetical protein